MPDRQNHAPAAGTATPASLEIQPVTPDRWDDLVALFETSPVMSSCWCMSPRLRAGEFSRFGAEARRRNRESMHGLVQAGTIPGLLAYAGDRPVGWISLGPREQFARLRHSPTLRPVHDLPVTGLASTFRALGFSEVGVSGRSRGQPRLVMRYDLPGALSQ